MAEQTFKSPGYFEREIDLSQRKPVKSNIVPGGIIGIAESGPAFVPITVSSITQFKETFGSIKPEYFGAIAANEFLKNTPNVTFVRTLGAGVIETAAHLSNFKKFGTVPSAGFQLSGSRPSADEAPSGEKRAVGCLQFLAGVHTKQTNEQYGSTAYSRNNTFNTAEPNLIRGAVLMASGARLEILSHNESYPGNTTTSDQAKISAYDGSKTQGTFKIVISSSLGTTFSNDEKKLGIKIYTASLDPDSQYYFGKVLNTSEKQFHSKQHLLYTDYIVERDVVQNKYDASNATVAVLSGSKSSSKVGDRSKHFQQVFGAFNTRYRNARTTSFISQPFGDVEYDLFHFETIADGASSNLYYSISISNIKKSLTSKNPYGTFTVELRSYNNDDLSLNIIEQFPNCSLNPDDSNFVGRLIGDSKLKYNFDTLIEKERGLINEGTYENKSKHIRIVLNSAVIDKKIPPSCLPFGFRGFPALKTSDTLSNTANAIEPGATRLKQRLTSLGAVTTFDHAVVPPLPFTYKVTKGNMNSSPSYPGDPSQDEITDSRIYWGIQAGRLSQNVSVNANGGLGNPELLPNVRIGNLPNLIDAYSKFLGIEGLDAVVTGSGADAFHNHKFTLSKVALNPQSNDADNINTALATELTASVTDHMKEAAYIRNGVIAQPNYTINDGTYEKRLTFGTLAAGKPATFNKYSEFMKFTNIFYGGFDGLNILDKDSQLMTDKGSSMDAGGKAAGGKIGHENLRPASSPGVGLNNNIISSYIQAAKAITLEGATNINMLIVPGIREKLVTNKISDLVRNNSKIIYLMDIPAFSAEGASGTRLYIEDSIIPSVEKTSDQFEGRGIDNNYVATYFPDVFLDSDQFAQRVKVPASVSAMQALSFNDRVAFPWFAPAGFARGVLDNVVTTAVRLTAADRDTLYEARINPIANFSIGKIVIFGQKTLQADRSALDRVNVRRMVLKVKRIVSNIAKDFLFEQNTPQTRAKFVASVSPQLGLIQSQQGIDKFRVVMDSSNNTALDEEQNRLNGSIVIVPSRAIEFIAIDFIITNAGVSF